MTPRPGHGGGNSRVVGGDVVSLPKLPESVSCILSIPCSILCFRSSCSGFPAVSTQSLPWLQAPANVPSVCPGDMDVWFRDSKAPCGFHLSGDEYPPLTRAPGPRIFLSGSHAFAAQLKLDTVSRYLDCKETPAYLQNYMPNNLFLAATS